MKNVIGLLVSALVLLSCNSGDKKNDPYSKVAKTTSTSNHPGKKLMETNCYLKQSRQSQKA